MKRIQAKKVIIGIERTTLQVDGQIARFRGECTVQIGRAGGCLIEDRSIKQRRSRDLPAYFGQALGRFQKSVHLGSSQYTQGISFATFYQFGVGIRLRIDAEEIGVKILEEILVAQFVEINGSRYIAGDIGPGLVRNAVSSSTDWDTAQCSLVNIR